MITSLNVNNFVGQEEWGKLQGDSIKKTNIWNRQKDYSFNYVENHLISDDDVVILHEVPYQQMQIIRPWLNQLGTMLSYSGQRKVSRKD